MKIVSIDKNIKYNSIDIMKFICSILVICIHTLPLDDINSTLDDLLVGVIARIAVPLFFISSGFLFYNKIKENKSDNKILFSYVERIIQLYIGWTLVYLILSFINGNLEINIINLLKQIFITGNALQLWYFPSLILSIILMYICSKKFKLNKVCIYASISMYIIGLLGTTYYSLLYKIPLLKVVMDKYLQIFVTTRNGLFFGFIFVLIGAYIAKNNKKVNYKKDFIFFIVSLGALGIEAIIVAKSTTNIYGRDMLIFLPIVSFYCFRIIISLNYKIKQRKIYIFLRNLSILVFGLHVAVMKYVTIENSLINFMVITIITLLISSFIIIIGKYKDIRRITRYLY